MNIRCDMRALTEYREEIRSFCRNAQTSFRTLKKQCEGAEWDDDVYAEVIAELNEAAARIASALSQLGDGTRVRFLDDLIPLVEGYLATAPRFPQ